MEDKSVDNICEWLAEKGFPESLRESFRGETVYIKDEKIML